MDKGETKIKILFFCYIFVMFVVVLLLSGLSVKTCSSLHDKIIARHAYIYEPTVDAVQEKNSGYSYGYTIPYRTFPQRELTNPVFPNRDKLLCHILEFLTVALPFLFLCVGIWISASVFYSKRLKKPFHLLRQGIAHIEQGDLDFSLEYTGRDELGDLCEAFETMRQKVVEKNTELWNMVDERKKLNASVAHDLRTPITIIKGYSEYLMRNLGNGAVSQEKQEEILLYIQNAAGRLEAYADSVHHIHILENIELEFSDVELPLLCAEITSALKVLAQKFSREIYVSADLPNRKVCISATTVFRILENIVKNACYYSKKNVFVEWALLDKEYFTITVTDDGDGFSNQSLHKAFRPYYKGERKENHYGMGLTICKILAEKHGGNIFLGNASGKGAQVLVKLKYF